jgi:hypothetical protein
MMPERIFAVGIIPPGIEVDCELFDPPLRASEIEEIRIRRRQ